MAQAAALGSFVQQRASGKACVIATLATAIASTYEGIAAALDIPIDPETKRAQLPEGIDRDYRLLRFGWLATPLVAKEHSEMKGNRRRESLATSDQIKAALFGHLAVIGYQDPEVGEHALAWIRDHTIDCSNGELVSLQNITVDVALILTPLPAPNH